MSQTHFIILLYLAKLTYFVRSQLNHFPSLQQYSELFATIEAIARVNFIAYGISKNSFGPCAFELGPKTPLTMMLALGQVLAINPIKGIEPPCAIAQGLDPNTSLTAYSMTDWNQGSQGFAFQPSSIPKSSIQTLAPNGVFLVRRSRRKDYVSPFQKLGGNLMLTLKVIQGNIRFPASLVGGKPESPVTVRVGLQPLFISNSKGFSETVCIPLTFCKQSNCFIPTSLAFSQNY